MSSMTYTIFTLNFKEGIKWKVCLLFGMLVVTFLPFITGATHIGEYAIFDSYDQFREGIGIYGLAFGAFLVGVGTKMGNGCTSGHAVCGVPRKSKRSIVATILFMVSAMAIATLRKYVPFLGEYNYDWNFLLSDYQKFAMALFTALGVLSVVLIIYRGIKEKELISKLECLVALGIGMIFGAGLLIGGMVRRTKIIGFLSLGDGWDPSLLFIMVGALGVNFITFHFILKMKKPIIAVKFEIPTKKILDWNVIAGPIIFGLGWGICGFCPGPAMINMLYNLNMLIFIFWFAVGQIATGKSIAAIEAYQKKINEKKSN